MPKARYCLWCGGPLTELLDSGQHRLGCRAEGCGYIHYDNPTPVVAGLVEHPSGVLLVRNKGWPETWFGLVTGFLERAETPEAGILREIDEELGLQATLVGLIGLYSFEAMNQLIIAYHLTADGDVRLGDELEAFKAVPVDRLKPWPVATGLAVRDWLARRSP